MRAPQYDPEDPIMRLAMQLYNSGYNSGHHDTVEGAYLDIHRDDMETCHDEEVEEIIQGFILNREITEGDIEKWNAPLGEGEVGG